MRTYSVFCHIQIYKTAEKYNCIMMFRIINVKQVKQWFFSALAQKICCYHIILNYNNTIRFLSEGRYMKNFVSIITQG